MMFMARWFFPPMGMFLLLMAIVMGWESVGLPLPVVTARAIGLMAIVGTLALIVSAMAWREVQCHCSPTR